MSGKENLEESRTMMNANKARHTVSASLRRCALTRWPLKERNEMSDDRSLDLTGVGKLAKAIPATSWNKLVTTACKSFTDFIAPVTATTVGIGRYIEAKFDGLIEAQKVLAAETIRRAQEKVNKSERSPGRRAKPQVVVHVITGSSTQTEQTMHELWSNLLAREILDGDIHPEIPRLLEHLAPEDAHTLHKIASGSDSTEVKAAVKRIKEVSGSLSFLGFGTELKEQREVVERDYPFIHAHLEKLGLIYSTGECWALSPIGKELIRSVSDPSMA